MMPAAQTKPQTLKHAAKMVYAHSILNIFAASQPLHHSTGDDPDMESEEVLNYLLQTHVERMSAELFLCLAPTCLRHVSFKDCRHLTALDVAAILSKCCSPHVLSLENCEGIGVGVVIALSRPALTSLVTLNLSGCDHTKDEHVQELLKICTSLQHLLLAATPITDKAFLVRGRQQHHLEIVGQQKSSTQEQQWMAGLVTVDLCGCDFTNHGLLHLCSLSGPTLRSVNVQQTKVDFGGLLYLAGHSRLSANHLLRNIHRTASSRASSSSHNRDGSLKDLNHISKSTGCMESNTNKSEDRSSLSRVAVCHEYKQVSRDNLEQGDVKTNHSDPQQNPAVQITEDLEKGYQTRNVQGVDEVNSDLRQDEKGYQTRDVQGVDQVNSDLRQDEKGYQTQDVQGMDQANSDLKGDEKGYQTQDVQGVDQANSGLREDERMSHTEDWDHIRFDQAEELTNTKTLDVEQVQVTVDFALEEARDDKSGGKSLVADQADDEYSTDQADSDFLADQAHNTYLADGAKGHYLEAHTDDQHLSDQTESQVETYKTNNKSAASQTEYEQNTVTVAVTATLEASSKLYRDSNPVDNSCVEFAECIDMSLPPGTDATECSAMSLLVVSNDTSIQDDDVGFHIVDSAVAHSDKQDMANQHDRCRGSGGSQVQEDNQLTSDLHKNVPCDPLLLEGAWKERRQSPHPAVPSKERILSSCSGGKGDHHFPTSILRPPPPSPMFCPKLTALAFTVPAVCGSVQENPLVCFKTCLTANPLLKELRLHLASIDDAAACLDCSGLHTQLMEVIGDSVPFLQHLAVNQEEGASNSLDDACVARLLSKCIQLHSLDLSGCYALTDKAFQPLQSNQNMRTLNLSPAAVSLEIAFFVCAGQHSWLTALDLSWCEELEEGGLNQSLALCPSLTSLGLRRCPVTSLTLQVLAQHCTALRHLDIAGAQEVEDDGVVCMARALPQLARLDISGNSGLSDESIRALLTYCHQLETANFSCLPRITSQPFMSIMSGYSSENKLSQLGSHHHQQDGEEKNQLCVAGSTSNSHWQGWTQEALGSAVVPHRSTSYGSTLKHVDLSYCNCVSEDHMRSVVTVCCGGLVVINYYKQTVRPYPVLG